MSGCLGKGGAGVLAGAAVSILCAAEPVLFDTDSGLFTDDEVALILLLRHPDRVTVRGVTVVSGNVWARQGAEYMFYALDLLRRPDIRVYVGAGHPLVHTAEMASEAERRWGPCAYKGAFAQTKDWQPPPGGKFTGRTPEREDAVHFLIDAIEQQPGALTVLALGPMTNLAIALRLRPDIETRIKRLVFMGGNVHVLRKLDESGGVQLLVRSRGRQRRAAIPDSSQDHVWPRYLQSREKLTKPMFDGIVAVRTPVTEAYREGFGNHYPGFLKSPQAVGYLWDELAAAYLVDPSFVTSTGQLYLDVDTRFGPGYGGVTELDRKMAPQAAPVQVMLDLDFPKAFAIYKEALTRRP